MKFLWIEPVGGCSGDMMLAALFDLGVEREVVEAGLRGLELEGWELDLRRDQKCGIFGTRVEVRVDDPSHAHDPTHLHPHGHDHSHDHAHASWSGIRRKLEAAPLPEGARRRALAIFERIAEAEAHVHGTTPDEVHFHEVGAVDSIVDIVGVALALDALGVDRIYASPPPLGSGIVRSQHGPIPVPAPATLEILKGREVLAGGPGERTTPTGAAILAALSEPGPPPRFTPLQVGYGVGHADFPDAANLLRATLCSAEGEGGRAVVLECNLDDATPQTLGSAVDAMLEAGALDAWVAPATMKKGRPAHLLGVLAPPEREAALTELLLRLTPTLGVRRHEVERTTLRRRFETVETRYGEIPIKIALLRDEIVNAEPEWEACVQAAKAHGIPPRRVREEASARWLACDFDPPNPK